MSEDEVRRNYAAREAEIKEKLELLCEHFEVPKGVDRMERLALAMAKEFVPGFKEARSAGRPSKWTNLNRAMLVVEVERTVRPGQSQHGVAWAVAQLATKEPWSSFLVVRDGDGTSPAPAEALRYQYNKTRASPWATAMRDAFSHHQHAGTLAEWDALVVDAVRNPHWE